MAFDQIFLEELRQRIPLHSIIARKVKLTRSGRRWKACCPFHGEKTPSFYVYDDHFHCYGCGVHGDVISFVMQNESRTFSEAVSELAGLAGLQIPDQTPQQKQRIDRQHTLYEVIQTAQDYYLAEFKTNRAKMGRDYLLRRGITAEIIKKFGLGWSGDGRGGLIDYLKSKGYSLEQIGEVGLLRRQPDDQWGGELFFNRIMYPICDRQGRVIAFGGRVIGDGQPKYLNSPETPLFSKRRVLFGLNNLSGLYSRKDIDPLYNTVVVVEGYMDVIALYQAGFHGAVAPLGTALTQDQMALLWRANAQPVLCFDGDGAGRRAMLHAAEEALPLLTSEQTLTFVTLPDGEDPDSFVQKKGKETFLEVIRHKQNLSNVVYDLLAEAMIDSSPEQRAALRARLISTAQQIKDGNLSREYRKALLDRFYEQFYQKRSASFTKKDNNREKRPLIRPNLQKGQVIYERMCILISLLIRYPLTLPAVEEAFCRLELPHELSLVREALMDFPADCGDINIFLEKKGLGATLQQITSYCTVSLPNLATADINLQLIEKQWWHFYGLLNIDELEEQVMQAQKEWLRYPDEVHQRTFIARLNALEAVKHGEDFGQDDDFLKSY